MYSSVRFQGRKLYEIAREGLVVEREKRTIEVKTLERTSDLVYEDGCCKFKFKTSVSKGTYIRTLCVEIGNRLGYPALMNNLNRTKSGSFHLENCVSIDDVLNNNYHL
jgi:tRNA pseudouridine55 synthase